MCACVCGYGWGVLMAGRHDSITEAVVSAGCVLGIHMLLRMCMAVV